MSYFHPPEPFLALNRPYVGKDKPGQLEAQQFAGHEGLSIEYEIGNIDECTESQMMNIMNGGPE